MKPSRLSMVLLTAVVVLCSCGRPSEGAADGSASTPTGGTGGPAGNSATAARPAVVQSPTQTGSAQPVPAQPAPAQAAAPQPEAAPAPPPSPAKPPEPKK